MSVPGEPATGLRAALGRYVADPKHGPLPALLLLLTIVTGLVDAASILALGRVFVANMTGNVVFVGFALAGAPGFSLAGSIFALIGFLIGAFGGGAAITRMSVHRGRLLRDTATAEFVLFVVAVLIAVTTAVGTPELLRSEMSVTIPLRFLSRKFANCCASCV